mmetsp:Transcript_37608/g.66111  ORF Transcript_37608/g.66111 Transcript_37608/m.66111 type:complete len:261 (-) Transcript_37608:1628-2410(-)
MIARGGLRIAWICRDICSTGRKPVVTPSLVFVGYCPPSLVLKSQVLVPCLGITHMMMVYGVSACSATSVAGLPGFNVAMISVNLLAARSTDVSTRSLPMITNGEVFSSYAPSPWQEMTNFCAAATFCENINTNSAFASSPTRAWKRDFTGKSCLSSLNLLFNSLPSTVTFPGRRKPPVYSNFSSLLCCRVSSEYVIMLNFVWPPPRPSFTELILIVCERPATIEQRLMMIISLSLRSSMSYGTGTVARPKSNSVGNSASI